MARWVMECRAMALQAEKMEDFYHRAGVGAVSMATGGAGWRKPIETRVQFIQKNIQVTHTHKKREREREKKNQPNKQTAATSTTHAHALPPRSTENDRAPRQAQGRRAIVGAQGQIGHAQVDDEHAIGRRRQQQGARIIASSHEQVSETGRKARRGVFCHCGPNPSRNQCPDALACACSPAHPSPPDPLRSSATRASRACPLRELRPSTQRPLHFPPTSSTPRAARRTCSRLRTAHHPPAPSTTRA